MGHAVAAVEDRGGAQDADRESVAAIDRDHALFVELRRTSITSASTPSGTCTRWTMARSAARSSRPRIVRRAEALSPS